MGTEKQSGPDDCGPNQSARDFDIDDLSQVIESRARAADQRRAVAAATEADSGAITLPIVIEEGHDVVDQEFELKDALVGGMQPLFRDKDGLYLRYRVAALGIGAAVEAVHSKLRRRLDGAVDALIGPPIAVDARYEAALFGGRPRADKVSRADAELLGDHLAAYRPNCLVLVNAGAVRRRFADRSAQQLALVTHCINRGALVNAQRPYSLVFVVDEPVPDRTFEGYLRACQQLGTPAAMMQFTVDETDSLVDYARFELRRYAANHLRARRRADVQESV